MNPTHPRRSILVTIVALIFLAWGGLVVSSVVIHKAWDPDSSFWEHSDHMWARIYVGGPETLEWKRLTAAQERAQMRYELPIHGAVTAWSLVTFVASLGLLRRKNWARLLFMGAMICAIPAIAWRMVLFSSLRMADTSDIVTNVVIVIAFGSIAWKLRSPSIVNEFRSERA